MGFEYKEVLKEVNEKLDVIHKDIHCASCEKLLVRSIQVKTIPKERQYKFTCPHCGDSSFVTTFKYHAHFEPVNCVIDNITCEFLSYSIEKEGKGNICLVTLK